MDLGSPRAQRPRSSRWCCLWRSTAAEAQPESNQCAVTLDADAIAPRRPLRGRLALLNDVARKQGVRPRQQQSAAPLQIFHRPFQMPQLLEFGRMRLVAQSIRNCSTSCGVIFERNGLPRKTAVRMVLSFDAIAWTTALRRSSRGIAALVVAVLSPPLLRVILTAEGVIAGISALPAFSNASSRYDRPGFERGNLR